MMKGMIKGGQEKETQVNNDEYKKLLLQFPFVEKQKPAPKGSAPMEIDDYTSEKQLKALMQKESA